MALNYIANDLKNTCLLFNNNCKSQILLNNKSCTEKKTYYFTTKPCSIIPWKLPGYKTKKTMVHM